jgi:spore coat polysaccharide biosynthesis protein SpsF
MKTVAIIQARMGSQRLPGKTLNKIANYTLLETVVNSVRRNHFINHICVATTNLSIDDAIEAKCKLMNIDCYRGDSFDVLSRFIAVAKHLNPTDTIVRVTADNPINNHKASEILYTRHLIENADYTCIDGLSHTVYEFVKVEALLKIANNNDLDSGDKEHVTKYIREHTNEFKVQKLSPNEYGINPELDKLLTIDTIEDYQRFETLSKEFDFNSIIDFASIYNFLNQKNNV